MRDKEILPCPFCGSTNVKVGPPPYTGGVIVFCCNCEAEGPYKTTDNSAIQSWNTRIPNN